MTLAEPLATASLEIRAPRPLVFHRAADMQEGLPWVWEGASLPNVTGDTERPDGSRRLVLSNGDQFSIRVESRNEPEALVLQTLQRPGSLARGSAGERVLRYRLSLQPGPGTTRVTLVMEKEGKPSTSRLDAKAQKLRWQRIADGALQRLSGRCQSGVEGEEGNENGAEPGHQED